MNGTSLGAAILMPQKKKLIVAMWYFAGGKKLNPLGGVRISYKLSLSLLCRQFAVSKSAAVIRWRHLGYIEDRPYWEYPDPFGGVGMKKNIRISEPSEEMMEKIRKASCHRKPKTRMVKCPFCGHNSIAVFEDTRGHVQAKCKRLWTGDRL